MKKSSKKSKILNIAILAIGLAFIVTGIVFIFISSSHTGYNGGTSYASTSIKFGADFYTTSAQYTGLAANALVDLFSLVKWAFALFFILVGMLIDLLQLKCMVSEKSKAKTESEIGMENTKSELKAGDSFVAVAVNETTDEKNDETFSIDKMNEE